jgi:exopolysaccharide production protein ExoZ
MTSAPASHPAPPPASASLMKSRSLNTLQAGRAGAALAVLLFHTNAILSLSKYLGRDVFPLFKSGASGVQFFFVLSGFVILLVHEKDVGNPAKIGEFLSKRFRRIYPPLWIVLLIITPVYFLIPSFGVGGARSLSMILSTFLLTPASRDLLLAPAWTLRHEVLFYLIFCVSIWSRSVGLAVGAVWIVLSAVVPFCHPGFPGNFFFNSNHLLFAFGALVCLIFKHSKITRARAAIVAILGAIMFSSVWFAELYHVVKITDVLNVLYGVAGALLILGLVATERESGISVPKVLIFLGEASYSIYLVHYSALSVVIKLVMKMSGRLRLEDWAVYVTSALLALLAGVSFHLLVERPLLNRLPPRVQLRQSRLRGLLPVIEIKHAKVHEHLS